MVGVRETVFALSICAIAGCEGRVEMVGPRGPGGRMYDAGSSTDDGTGGTPIVCTEGENYAAVAPVRRLSRVEYDNTLQDLFAELQTGEYGFTVPHQDVARDNPINGFENNSGVLVASPLLVEQYEASAREISRLVVAVPEVLGGCSPDGGNEAPCGEKIIERFGARVFRRPLTSDELDRYRTFFRGELAATGNFGVATQLVLQALLQSPQFLYRLELGPLNESTPPQSGGLVRLTPYELATRLSYLLWASMPDQALFDAAGSGALESQADIETQARRMLADPKARRAMREFARQWLDLDRILITNKDHETHPAWTDSMAEAMREETLRFVEHVAFDGDGSLDSLFTSSQSYVTDELAELYGASARPGAGLDEMQLVDLPTSERAGLLTQGSFLASRAHEVYGSPVLRGVFVLSRMLCIPPPPPLPGIDITPPREGENAPRTNRDRYAAHTTRAVCQSCHQKIDPIGFALEGYDSLGRFRTMDNGVPVDATSALAGTDVDGAIDGALGLSRSLAASEMVRRCMTTQWFRNAYGRAEARTDRCAIDAIDTRFETSNERLPELLIAIVTSPEFAYRRIATEEDGETQ